MRGSSLALIDCDCPSDVFLSLHPFLLRVTLEFGPENSNNLSSASQIKSLSPCSYRKVQTESNTGSVGSSRVRTTLTLCVETIDFDSQACRLRVKGTNLEENQYVKVWNIQL